MNTKTYMVFVILSIIAIHFVSACFDEIECSKDICASYCQDGVCVGGFVCPKEKPICHEYTCVECTKESGCQGHYVCNEFDNICVECNSNFDCTSDPERAICDTENNKCVQCKNKEDCDRDYRCGSACDNGRCTYGLNCSIQGLYCKSDYEEKDPPECVECTQRRHCNGTFDICIYWKCQECLNTIDCRNSDDDCGYQCSMGKCVQSHASRCSEIQGTKCDKFLGQCVNETETIEPNVNNAHAQNLNAEIYEAFILLCLLYTLAK